MVKELISKIYQQVKLLNEEFMIYSVSFYNFNHFDFKMTYLMFND